MECEAWNNQRRHHISYLLKQYIFQDMRIRVGLIFFLYFFSVSMNAEDTPLKSPPKLREVGCAHPKYIKLKQPQL